MAKQKRVAGAVQAEKDRQEKDITALTRKKKSREFESSRGLDFHYHRKGQ
jgi:hypothetical protein